MHSDKNVYVSFRDYEVSVFLKLRYVRHAIAVFVLSATWMTTIAQKEVSAQIKEFDVPSGWYSCIHYDTSYFPLFKQKQVASWTLSSITKGNGVTFYIYNYSDKDSASFRKKMIDYYMLSSCLNYSSTIAEENFMSFVKGNYFFLMEMCPCSTAENLRCRTLAKKLFLWAHNK